MTSQLDMNLETFFDQISQDISSCQSKDELSIMPIVTQLEALANAAGACNRNGFQDICLLIQEKFTDIIGQKGNLDDDEFHLFERWLELASVYVNNSNVDSAQELLNFFSLSNLYSELQQDDLDIIKDMLTSEYDSSNIAPPSSVTNSLSNDISRFLIEINNHDLPAIHQTCLLILKLIDQQIRDQIPVEDKQATLIQNWLSIARAYLTCTGDTDPIVSIVRLLNSDAWPLSIDKENIEIIRSIADMERNKTLLETIDNDVLVAFKEFRNTYCVYEADYQDFLLKVAKKTELLGIATEKTELTILKDACFLISERLFELARSKSLKTQDHVMHVAKWLVIVTDCLGNRSPSTSAMLLDYLKSDKWLSPVDHSTLRTLEELLLADFPHVNNIYPLPVANITGKNEHGLSRHSDESSIHQDKYQDVIDTSDTLAAPHTISLELVDMLREEMAQMKHDLHEKIAAHTAYNENEEAGCDFLKDYSLRLERFGSASQAAEMDGLYQASLLLSENFNIMAAHTGKSSEEITGLLEKVTSTVLAYLEHPGDDEPTDRLLVLLQDSILPKPLLSGVTPALKNLLQAVYITDKDINSEPRKTQASDEDVSLSLPEDINEELLNGLLQELPAQTQALSSAIQSLHDGSGDITDIQKAQRIAHTIKGSANTVGVKGLAVITHQLEDILSALVNQNQPPGQSLTSTLSEASDCLEEMSEALSMRAESPANSRTVLQQILDWANRIDSEGIKCLQEDEPAVKSSQPVKDQSQSMPEAEVDAASRENQLTVPASKIDRTIRLMGENMIVSSQIHELLKQSELQSQRLSEQQNIVQQLITELEIQIETDNTKSNPESADNKNSYFDVLEFEEYNELHSIVNRIAEASTDCSELNRQISYNFQELDELVLKKNRFHQEIQELVFSARMIPIKQIIPRLQRIVRQTARKTNKKIELQLSGTNTLIDSDVLARLTDPLMHILRNAVDHGIEDTVTRRKIGKSETGILKLSFSRDGTHISVKCQDDGCGLDEETIRETAIKRGLVRPDEEIDQQQLYRLILLPGFSTRKKITQTSGRGIGMDVVNSEIISMKGSVHVESNTGNGCLIQLNVPITLMSSHANLISNNSQTVAISNHAVERILHPGDYVLADTNNEDTCIVNDENFKYISLESLIYLHSGKEQEVRHQRPALLLREGDIKHVVSVDEIVDTRDIFIKPIGDYLNNMTGVLGATILGDGNVVSVIDLPELIRAPSISIDKFHELTQTDIHQSLPTAMVVDDSLSARRAVSQVLQDNGFVVSTAKDGLEAIELMQKQQPDILFVDMEMPKMNGIELTSHVRGSVKSKNIPVIMITSRTTEKHKSKAIAAGVDIYLSKPFSEDELLDYAHSLLD